jgi:predicted RNA-binding Zn ribbon-like protein
VSSRSDDLSSPEVLVAWLVEHELIEKSASASAGDLTRARALREALRALCLANGGDTLDAEAPAVLNDAATRAGLGVRFEPDGQAALEPSKAGIDGAMGRLLAIVAEAMRAGSWARLKACRSEDCRWAFYDVSKNRSRAWCSMAVCGNRAKARSFRERHPPA